jgi:hypothetical protein
MANSRVFLPERCQNPHIAHLTYWMALKLNSKVESPPWPRSEVNE